MPTLRRLEAARDTLPGRIAGWERPEGPGPGVRKRARPRTRSSPSDCRVAPSPSLRYLRPRPPGKQRARPLCASASAASPVRTSGTPGCASAPHVVFAGLYDPDPRYCRCANHSVEDSRESTDRTAALSWYQPRVQSRCASDRLRLRPFSRHSIWRMPVLASGKILTRTEAIRTRGAVPEIEAETSRLPADPERHDHRARSGDLKAVFDAPRCRPRGAH